MNRNCKVLVLYISFTLFMPIIFYGIQHIGNLYGKSLITDEQGTVLINLMVNGCLFFCFCKAYWKEIKEDWKQCKKVLLEKFYCMGLFLL